MAALLSGEIYFFFLSSSHFSPFRQHLVIDYSVCFFAFGFVCFEGVCMCVCWSREIPHGCQSVKILPQVLRDDSYLALNAKAQMQKFTLAKEELPMRQGQVCSGHRM